MANMYKHPKTNVGFIHNPQLEGEVTIRLPKADSDGHDILRVPGSALLDFVCKWMVDQKIAKISEQDPLNVVANQFMN